MTFKKLNSKAFSHIEIFIVIVVIAIISGIGYFVYNKNTSHAGGYNYVRVITVNWNPGLTQ